MILEEIAKRLLQPVNTSVISILGMFNLLLGVWLFLPFLSLGAIGFPEWIIGFAMVAVGSLIVHGALKDKLKILMYGTGAGFYFWFSLMAVALLVQWQSGAWIVCLMIAVYCGFVHINLRVNTHNVAP